MEFFSAAAMSQVLVSTPWFDVTPANLLEAVFVTFSIIGQEFIVRRDRRGFHFYIAGNLVAIVMFMAMGRWMSCVLYAYFIVKSIQANLNWRALERQSSSLLSNGASQPAARGTSLSSSTPSGPAAPIIQ